MNTKAFRERWPSIAQIPCVGDMLAAMDAVEANRQEALTELADCERRLREATQDAVANGQEVKRLERESFERITALRLALRQVHDLADATEPCSVQAGQIAARALEVDGSVEYRRDAEHAKRSDPALYRAVEG